MTRLEIIQQWARFFGKNATSLDALTKQRCIDYLNTGQRQLLSSKRFSRLRDVQMPLASVADQADYALIGVSKPLRIWDTTNDRWIFEMSEAQYREIGVTGISGTPDFFVWRGRSAVAKQPSDASALFFDSTSASDTQVAYVEGVITGGYQRSANVTLTGTTAVALSATISDWIRVDKVYLASAAAGIVTLLEDSGSGTELARIAIGKTATPYQMLSLYPTPSAVNSYLLDVTREITDLAQDTDAPLLPDDFHDLLLLRAKRDECLHLNDKRFTAVVQEYKEREGQLAHWMAQTGVVQPYGLGTPLQQPSQLGGWYPMGS